MLSIGSINAQMSDAKIKTNVDSLELWVSQMTQIKFLRGFDGIYVNAFTYEDGGFHLSLEDQSQAVQYSMDYYHRYNGVPMAVYFITKKTESTEIKYELYEGQIASSESQQNMTEFFTKYQDVVKRILAGEGKEWVSKNKQAKDFFKKFTKADIEADVAILIKNIKVEDFEKSFNSFKSSSLNSDPYASVLKEAGKSLKKIIDDDYSSSDWRTFCQRMFSIFDGNNSLKIKTLIQTDPDANKFLEYLSELKQSLDAQSQIWVQVKNI